MAVTSQQQYLADLAQEGNQEQCCIALGGQVSEAPDEEGVQVCEILTTSFDIPDLFYLSPGNYGPGACGYASQLASNSATQGGQAGGGGVGQALERNLSSIFSFATDIFRISRQSTAPAPTGTTPPPAVDTSVEDQQRLTRQILTAVGVVAGLALIVYFIRKK